MAIEAPITDLYRGDDYLWYADLYYSVDGEQGDPIDVDDLGWTFTSQLLDNYRISRGRLLGEGFCHRDASLVNRIWVLIPAAATALIRETERNGMLAITDLQANLPTPALFTGDIDDYKLTIVQRLITSASGEATQP